MRINDVQFNCDLIDVLQELISQLRANDINLIQKYKEGPTHIQICCPYHSNGMERRPSAGLRKEDGLFHCFACNEVHTLQEVISHCFGHTDDITGKFGWSWLLKNFATIEVDERKDVRLDFIRPNSDRGHNFSDSYGQTAGVINSSTTSNDTSTKTNRYITEEELDSYRYIHPYMYKRGLTDDVIRLFDIGYDSNTDCITFPVRDITGNTLFIARRSVKIKFFNYPQGVEKPLYGLYEIYETHSTISAIFPSVIVCESMLDALSFWTIGRYAVALNGLGTELQLKQLIDLPCRHIILATDMDERGLAARKRIRKNLEGKKLISEYIFPKGRKDANDCTKEELMRLKEIL